MLNPTQFRDLVSGRQRGLRAAALRAVLRLAETPYSLAVRWRNRGYDQGNREIHRVSVPVVSVGNLTLGGTGKTPMVEWIARWFRRHGVRVTVVSRGYGAESGVLNDEGQELEQRLPDVPHVQNPDRVAGAQMAIEEFDCQLIVLDDAFQHRRIARDLDVVLLDALEPFGFDHVFPRGTLREPLAGLRRADAVILARADLLTTGEREAIREKVSKYAPNAIWAEATHAPQSLQNAAGGELTLGAWKGEPVAAFCGVGNPAGFRHTLEMCGYQVIGFREYADHYRYARADVESLAAWADELDAAAVLCTHKDLVKLGVERLGDRPLWAVTIAMQFLAGEEAFQTKLRELLPTKGP